MPLIQNLERLSVTEDRRRVLEIVETGLDSIQPEEVINKTISKEGSLLKIQDSEFELSGFERVYILGFGKGSARNSRIIEDKIGEHVTGGFVIDTIPDQFQKVSFTQGTHPLPSEQNISFTKMATDALSNLTEKDLVLVVVCGGGSALFELPYNKTLEEQTKVFKALLTSGANITDMNIVRKHLSLVKGGGLAKILYPATIVSLFFSDVPGNDLSVIASAPTVKDPTTVEDALAVLRKYNIHEELKLTKEDFTETPQEDKYFERTHNIFILSNLTILNSMKEKAESMGLQATIFSDKFQGEAREAGNTLIESTPDHHILLAGGETTVTVLGEGGKGGRNQEVVLGALSSLDENTIIVSFGTDGQDNSEHAGAIGDVNTIEKAKIKNLNPQEFINNSNSYPFFETVEDAIITGKLPSNVADIILVYKK